MSDAERLAERLHPKDEFRNDMSEREIEILARKMCDYPEIRAPVQGFPGGIPWEMHMRAYEAYAKRWSPQVALINLYGRGCRGGFGTGELDGFIPGWRDELSERTCLLARIAALEDALRAIEEGTIERPILWTYREDGKPSKHDRCIHGARMWETCAGCIDAHIAKALGKGSE